jgi:hypothetical protein
VLIIIGRGPPAYAFGFGFGFGWQATKWADDRRRLGVEVSAEASAKANWRG